MVARLIEFGPDIWISDGPVVPFFAGFSYPTRMAVIRLSNGLLFVWSPITLSEQLKREVDALGTVRYLVSPNLLHHLFLGEWASAYPKARLYASPGLRRRRKDLAFDADLGDAPEPEWAADIDQVVLGGSFVMTEVVFFHRASRTAIFADLIENLPRDWFKGWRGVAARLRRRRRAKSGRSTRMAPQLHQSPRRASGVGAHPRLADRTSVDRPWRVRGDEWRGVRSKRFRLAAWRRSSRRAIKSFR